MSEHTPGPWQIDPAEQHDTSGSRIFKVCNAKPYGGLIADVSAWWVDTQSAEANARLIAAAPELLKALKMVVNKLEGWSYHSTAAKEGRAAIALASAQEVESG